MTNTIIQNNTCNHFNISRNNIVINACKPKESQRKLEAKFAEFETSHKADPFVNRDDINMILFDLYERGQIHKATAFIFGINTGYRCGDILSFRVCDLIKDSNCVDVLYVREQKTGRVRPVYLNSTVQKSIEYLVRIKSLKPQNYLFRGDGQLYLFDHK
ncbi:MAG: hypothetical protein K2F81_05235 [Ruminococcus sp.]|nr:hypothetical protein [Ruminococcus sp.]